MNDKKGEGIISISRMDNGKAYSVESEDRTRKLLDGIELTKGIDGLLTDFVKRVKWEDFGFPDDYEEQFKKLAKSSEGKDTKGFCYYVSYRNAYSVIEEQLSNWKNHDEAIDHERLLQMLLVEMKYKELYEREVAKHPLVEDYRKYYESKMRCGKKGLHDLVLGRFDDDPRVRQIERIGVDKGCIKLAEDEDRDQCPTAKWLIQKQHDKHSRTTKKSFEASMRIWKEAVQEDGYQWLNKRELAEGLAIRQSDGSVKLCTSKSLLEI